MRPERRLIRATASVAPWMSKPSNGDQAGSPESVAFSVAGRTPGLQPIEIERRPWFMIGTVGWLRRRRHRASGAILALAKGALTVLANWRREWDTTRSFFRCGSVVGHRGFAVDMRWRWANLE